MKCILFKNSKFNPNSFRLKHLELKSKYTWNNVQYNFLYTGIYKAWSVSHFSSITYDSKNDTN